MNDYIAWFDGACQPVNPGGTATSGIIVKTDGCRLLITKRAHASVKTCLPFHVDAGSIARDTYTQAKPTLR
jgi:hypothetical protein